MQSERTERLANVVASALECAVAERPQFLSDVCGDDFALRQEAESLLRFEENARDFIETPAYEIAANEVSAVVSEPPTEQEPIPQYEAPERVTAQEPIPESEVIEPTIAQEAVFENEHIGSVTEQESIFTSEATELAIAPEPILENERIEQAPTFPSEATELIITQELNLEDEPDELITEQESPPSEVTEPVTAQEPILESEPIEPITGGESTFTSETNEVVTAQEPILENAPNESVTEQESILESKATEPVIAQEPMNRSEAVIESGPERRSAEIDRRSHKETVAAAVPEPPKPKSKPVLPVKGTSHSFEIPDFSAKQRVPSRAALWLRRAALVAVVLFVLAMLLALNSAFQSVRNAQRQRDVATTEKSRAERINGYLQQILSLSDQNFTSVWPVPQNRNITITRTLDRVAPRVPKELRDQPAARGELLRIIGKTYASQGDHDAAEKNLRAALETQTAIYGEQNGEITETMVDLGILLYRRERFDEAEEFLEKGVTFLRKQNQTEGGRVNAVKLAHALDGLGAVKFYRGEVKAGRAILEEALAVATQAQPEARDRPLLTHIQTDLGGLLVLIGELTKGERLLQEALAESRAAKTAPQWETGMTLQMLGELALARNRPPEADENFMEAEKIYRETLGENNLYFARNLERRATVSLLENALSTAEQLTQRSLALTKECSPGNKLPWTDPMMTLSSILLREGRDAEGEDYLRKTIGICEEQPTRNYAAIALAKIRLSQLLLLQKRFTEAENIAFEVHNQAQQHLESQDPMRKATTTNLIEIYEAQEKHKAARAVK